MKRLSGSELLFFNLAGPALYLMSKIGKKFMPEVLEAYGLNSEFFKKQLKWIVDTQEVMGVIVTFMLIIVDIVWVIFKLKAMLFG